VFDDFGRGSSLWRRFAIHESDGPEEPLRSLSNNPALPIARPHIAQGSDGRDGRHPIVALADEVVTNHPIILEHPELTRLLEFDTGRGVKTLALTGVIEGRGRLLVCGDSSVFLNLMLRYPGNRALAEGVVRYLLERETENSTGNLYVVHGSFSERGEFGHSKWDEEARKRIDAALADLRDAFQKGLPPIVCTALATLLLAILFARARSEGAFIRARIIHRFTGQPETAPAFVGESSRFEVLAAKTTTPLLAVAELAHAFEAFLGDKVDEDGPLGPDELARVLADCEASDRKQWIALYAELTTWRRELAQKKRRIPSENELRSLHNRTIKAVDSLTLLWQKDLKNQYGPRTNSSPR
jgi:hypothetical protein